MIRAVLPGHIWTKRDLWTEPLTSISRNCRKKTSRPKAVLFSDTNVQLREYVFGEADRKPGSIWQLLMALKECGLKNDAMLDVFYEEFVQRYRTDSQIRQRT